MGAPAPGQPATDYTLNVRGNCRSCGQPIWWRKTALGKRQPMNLDPATGEPTSETHFASCPQSRAWSKKGQR